MPSETRPASSAWTFGPVCTRVRSRCVDDGIGGIAVHIAAQVEALADPGQVLVSRTVVDLIVGSGIEFADRGEHELRGVPGTWRLFAVEG